MTDDSVQCSGMSQAKKILNPLNFSLVCLLRRFGRVGFEERHREQVKSLSLNRDGAVVEMVLMNLGSKVRQQG